MMEIDGSTLSKMDAILVAQRMKRAKIENDAESSMSSHMTGYQQCMRSDSSSKSLLNFTTAADELELSLKRQKIPRDPMSHRIIEKRRRDRMNNCLADLSRLIPSTYHKQGQGRIEKTEIIEMAIKHINLLQQRVEIAEKKSKEDPPPGPVLPVDNQCCASKFYLGFKEAQDEVMRFWVEVQNASTMDPFCKKIMKHLERASKKFITNHWTMKSVNAEKKETQWDFSDQQDTDPSDDQQQSNKRKRDKSDNWDAPSSQSSRCMGPMLDKPEDHPMDGSQSVYMQRERSSFESNRLSGGSDRLCSSDRVSGSAGDMRPDESYQEIEAKNRDKHLRSLLTDQQHSSSPQRNNSNETGNNGIVPVFSYSNMSNRSTGDLGSSGYLSDLSRDEKSSSSGYNPSRNDNVYKFKHNITKRFSQEGHHIGQGHQHQPSDTSSSASSRDFEDDQRHFKWKSASTKGAPRKLDGGHDTMFHDNDETSHTKTTNCNATDSVSTKDCKRQRNSTKSSVSGGGDRDCDSAKFMLPGFILHPSGTHYMPISVQNTNISGLLDDFLEEGDMPVFHPISIPVHFRRPVI